MEMVDVPGWLDKTPEEIEELIVELAEEGNPPSRIGMILRDKYGVPNVKKVLNKSLLEILQAHDLDPDIPEDLKNMMKEAVKLRDHLDRNPKDVSSQRRLEELESNIHKLSKYYRREGGLPKDWRYDPEEAVLLVRG